MARKGENIRKRKDGRWEGRYKIGINENGVTKFRSVYGHTYSEVKKKLNDARVNLDMPNVSRYKEISLNEVARLWIKSNQIRLKGSTVNKYRYMLETHILPELGKMSVLKLTSATINTFLHKKLTNGRLDGMGALSPSYVRTLSIIISALLSYAAKEEYCSPLKTPVFKPRSTKKEMQILSHSVQRQFEELMLSEIDLTKYGTYICLQTGIRLGELCALTWDDIDFNSRIIHVRHTVARVSSDDTSVSRTKLIIDKPKTDASVRDIPITSVLLPILKNMYDSRSSRFVVSDKPDFISTRTFDSRYRKMLIGLGVVPINFHALRHTFATRCVDAGVDIKSLSEILGHSSVAITLDTYVHPSIELKRNQIEKLHTQFS